MHDRSDTVMPHTAVPREDAATFSDLFCVSVIGESLDWGAKWYLHVQHPFLCRFPTAVPFQWLFGALTLLANIMQAFYILIGAHKEDRGDFGHCSPSPQ